jgi:hypothetical protein
MIQWRLDRRWTKGAALAVWAVAGVMAARSLPADPAAPGGRNAERTGEPRLLLAQAFGQQGFGQGFGQQGGGGPFQGGQLQRGGTGMSQFQGGRQGGAFTSGGVFGVGPGQTVQLAAACTDLLAEPPDETTRFTGGNSGEVMLADGSATTLAGAIQSGVLAVRGRSDSFDPIRRDGSLLLDLYLVNTSRVPVQVAVQPGATVTPSGQSEQALPQAERLLALAARKGFSRSNTVQYAVWAARGNTAEEVEQTNMLRLHGEEIAHVQSLLDGSGIERRFDRDRGVYPARYEAAAERLPEERDTVKGTTFLLNGYKAAVEGLRAADGKGVVTVKPLRANGGEFFYGAEFKDRKDGKVEVKLIHLATGRPLRANRGSLLLTPTAG